ncbi:glycoside hydrolase family 3 protein [Mucilaginibacter flavidus]|uniref:glycoside hydrolase family 3 protein n=1 Tax=Mucilaginibacter flavidus TaxID=2949309 RepID=UPI002092C221|nr:glycoside hydrolase family 3 N-terminal domain-containing protein [Mucilaginibacter flavidus]MCO5946287.1 glycoside hydrolase family 3 [Mucilaginibacter flavidus]
MALIKHHLKYIAVLVFCFISLNVSAQKDSYIQSLNHQNHWVDSVFKKLSRKKKIAQLFFVRAHTDRGQAYEDSVAKVIKDEQLGGVVFFQGGPVRHAQLINNYQKLVKVPLLITMDGEWGLGMRIDSTISYPFQMTLGAIQDNSLIYKMGEQVGYDFKRLGMQMNLGPDMDVNNNPNNPVINYRSFGDNKYNVAAKGIAYFKGMQDAGILTTAKHFPGHGDTNVDSHLDLPLLPFTRQRLDSLEEYPFQQAINADISGVMIAHMNIPALDTTKNLPSTLSRPIVTGELKDSLRFKGLVVSDAMEMKAVIKYFPDGEADLRAFLAGNDIIELSENSERAIKKIRKAIRKHKITKEEFNAKVKKVLAAKYWAGLNQYHETDINHLAEDLHRPAATNLIQQLSDAAVTLVKGSAAGLQMIPLHRTALVSVGAEGTVFQAELAKWYTYNRWFNIGKTSTAAELNDILTSLKDYDQVYVSINDTRARPASKLDYSADIKQFISSLAAHNNTVITLFANAYTIADLPGIEKCSALLVCYQMTDALQRSAVKVITQQLKPTGRLPVTINKDFTTGMRGGL